MNLKKIGDTSVGESHESGAITVEEFKTRTVVKRGMFAELKNLLPVKGAKYEEGWWVTRAQLSPNPGGTGTLTITLADSQGAGGGAWEPGAPEILEVEWSKIEKPIQTNPKITNSYTGTQLQTAVDELEAWRNSPQQRRRKYQIPLSTLTREADPNSDADWIALTGVALNLAKKIAQGIESYLVFSPIVSRTVISKARPSTGGCGTIQTPPVPISGYKFLKVADSAVQQTDGTWRRTEQWQGADSWDTDLYA